MAELLKNRYNYQTIGKVAHDIQFVYKTFPVDEFLNSTIDKSWESLELKERIYKISLNLGKYLPSQYGEAIAIIDQVVMNYGNWLDGFGAFFPTFVEIYGQNEVDWEQSISALERYTQYASAEFAVRPFIINDQEKMMSQMLLWSKSSDENVRRLSSEGCRPALPWGQGLKCFKLDPTPILPILEALKTDPSIHVRKSVANNLNDISKTHPEVIKKIVRAWSGKKEETNWILKHGCRTLLKRGDREILGLFGYDDISTIEIRNFILKETSIIWGQDLLFSFEIETPHNTKVRLEYCIDYVKSNGKRSRKIYSISQVSLRENERKIYTKKQSFADVSVRKHYPGIHSITLLVNGMERGTLYFELKA